MPRAFIRFIPGMGHQVVDRDGGVAATYDERDEAEDHQDKLNEASGSEADSPNWGK